MREVADWKLERDAAVADVTEMRDTHLQWRDHLRECDPCPHLGTAGNIDHHQVCIRQYDRIIHVLNYAVAAVDGGRESNLLNREDPE